MNRIDSIIKNREYTREYLRKYPERRQRSSNEYMRNYMRIYQKEINTPKKKELNLVEPDDSEAIEAIKQKYKDKLKSLHLSFKGI